MPNRPKGIEHEAGERRQLELDQGDEELDRHDEEGEQHHHPGEQQHRDLDEILEEADVAHQAGDRVEDGPAGVEPDLGDAAGPQKSAARQTRSGGFQAEAGKSFRR